MYTKAFFYSLKYFFLSPLWITILLICILCTVMPLIFVSTPAIPVSVYDLDNTQESSRVYKNIAEGGTLNVINMPYEDAINALKTGELEAIFEIKQGFSNKIKNGDYSDTIAMQLSKYSVSARTLSDAVSACVMEEYSTNFAYNTVYKYTSNTELAKLAQDNALSSGLEIVSINTQGLTEPSASKGVNTSILTLASAICFMGLCFSANYNTSSVADKCVSLGKRFGIVGLMSQFGKLFPLMLLSLVPIIISGDISFGFYVFFLITLYTLVIAAFSALLLRLRLSLKLNIAVFFSILNAIFALSNIFSVSAPVIIFPGYALSDGIFNGGILPYAIISLLLIILLLPLLKNYSTRIQ